MLRVYQIVDFGFQILFLFCYPSHRKQKVPNRVVSSEVVFFIIPLVYLIECVNLFGLVVYHIGMITELFA